jgi:glycosyltransferase involved in cell wall biosynthesis
MSNPIRVLMIMKKFSGGPSVFRRRMSNELSKISGIKVVHEAKRHFDVELSFVRHIVNHRKPRIIRVDGCYFGRSEERRNRIYRESILSSTSVIYQSQFSKKMCESIMGINKPNDVVLNGINLKEIRDIPPDSSIPPGSFAACAIWRSNKRPQSMVKGFLEANTDRHLYVIGENKNIFDFVRQCRQHKRIHFVGSVDFPRVISILKSCSYFLHLTRIDSCPNAVIEALACGLNVLCTNLGGTREIVGEDGLIMDIDRCNLKRKMIHDDGDNIKPRLIADHIHKLVKLTKRPNRPDLDISGVAKKYVEIIRRVRG